MQKLLEKLRAGFHVTIVALGDSNTELTWHTAGHLNWVGLLQESLFECYGRNRAAVINAGCCGNHAGDGLARLHRDVLRFDPDLVIISFGMNDAGAAERGLDKFSHDMRELVSITSQNGCEVLLRTPNPVVVPHQPQLRQDRKAGLPWPGEHQGLYAKRIVDLAHELGVPVVDHYTLWSQAVPAALAESSNHLWMRMSDAFHPNQLGHLVFYRELAPLFELPLRFPWE